MQVIGLNDLITTLSVISDKALRDGGKKASLNIAKQIAKDYKRLAPKDTGLMAKSATALMSRSYKKGVYRAVAIVRKSKKVSARQHLSGKFKRRVVVGKDDKGRVKYGIYYAHFVEYGFKRGNKQIAGQKIMQKARALNEAKFNQIAQEALSQELGKYI